MTTALSLWLLLGVNVGVMLSTATMMVRLQRRIREERRLLLEMAQASRALHAQVRAYEALKGELVTLEGSEPDRPGQALH